MDVVIPSMADFMSKNLNNNNEKVLLTKLKSEIDNSIIFFQDQFITNDSDELINIKLDKMNTIGYENLLKIHSYLNILFLKDERIFNKQLYEQCLNNNISIGSLLDSISHMRDYNNDIDINSIIDIAQIIKNVESIENHKYIDMINEKVLIKKKNNKMSKINVYNSNINHYILMSYAMKQILSKAN